MDIGQGNNTSKKSSAPRCTSAPRGSKTASLSTTPVQDQGLKKSIFSKLQGSPLSKSYLEIVKGKPTDNICAHLLSKFEDAAICNSTAPLVTACQTAMPQIPRSDAGKWGPVVAARMSCRIKRDGKPIMQRAQGLKKVINLEIPRGWFGFSMISMTHNTGPT